MSKLPLVALVVALSLLTAGCSLGVTGGTVTSTPDAATNATVAVTNDGDRSYRVEVSLVVGRLTNVSLTGTDGVARPVGNLSALPGVATFDPRNVTDLDLPVPARSQTAFEIPPGSGVETELSASETETTLVVVVRRAGRVRAWATAYCGPTTALAGVDATLGDGGSLRSVGLQCRS